MPNVVKFGTIVHLYLAYIPSNEDYCCYKHTKLEAKNSQLRTGFLHKTDQQQLVEGTTREETCTLENCVNAELENNLGAQNRFEKMARISILLQLSWLRPIFILLYFFLRKGRS